VNIYLDYLNKPGIDFFPHSRIVSGARRSRHRAGPSIGEAPYAHTGYGIVFIGRSSEDITMGVRKNHTALSAEERARLTSAILQIKANGIYDRYVRQHRDMFDSGIHNSVLFLPWHREFLRRLERDLQAIDASIDLPYWDWTTDRSVASPLWAADFMGGNGVPPGGPVQDGPFAFRNGRWTLTVRDSSGSPVELTRNLQLNRLPTANTVRNVLASVPYTAFRRNVEMQSHNTVHTSIGGAAADASSPNDPIFFLLHCNVDRLWAAWQRQHPDQAPFQGDGRFNLNTPMPPWDNEPSPPTPASVLNHAMLGYTYDPDDIVMPQQIVDLTVGAVARQGNIGQAGERDWYRFMVPAAGMFTAETTGPTDVFMSLFGPNSQTDLVASDDDSGQDTNARLVAQLSAGAYFVQVRHFQPNGVGPYAIAVSGGPSAPLPGLPEIQVNGPPAPGNIAAANESDIYTFMVSAPASYAIETSGSTDVFMSLFGPNSQTAFVTQDDDSGPGANSRIVRTLLPGQYFVRIRHFDPRGVGAYAVSVRR
jgi:tyrosinase